MSNRRIALAAAALTALLAITVFFIYPSMRPGAQAGPNPQAPIAPEAEAAVADLAGRLSVDAGQIAVDSVRAETWGDTSLGLPEADMMYAQVITEGHVVTLSYGGKSYVYHVAADMVKLAP